MEIVFIFFIIAVAAFLFYYISNNQKPKQHKSSAVKKEEIICKYEEQMKALIKQYEHEPDLLKTKKIDYLKKASNQIHNNIFFSNKEARALVQRLASL